MGNKKANVTYHKRKRGIVKKCIDLSTICDQDMYLYAVDRKTKRVFEYCSTPDFNIQAVVAARKDKDKTDFSKYFNSDYELLLDNMTPRKFQDIETTHKRMLKQVKSIMGQLENVEKASTPLISTSQLT